MCKRGEWWAKLSVCHFLFCSTLSSFSSPSRKSRGLEITKYGESIWHPATGGLGQVLWTQNHIRIIVWRGGGRWGKASPFLRWAFFKAFLSLTYKSLKKHCCHHLRSASTHNPCALSMPCECLRSPHGSSAFQKTPQGQLCLTCHLYNHIPGVICCFAKTTKTLVPFKDEQVYCSRNIDRLQSTLSDFCGSEL